MDQSEKSGFDRAKYLIGFVILAAAVLLGITAYFGANSARDTVGTLGTALEGAGAGNFPAIPLSGTAEEPQAVNSSYVAPNGSVATGTGGEAQVPQASATKAKEVTIDFLYADWCSHCQAMKPIVARLETSLPKDRFEVRYWNEASRTDATVAAIYTTYTNKGYFTGFPTFVANGDDPKIGSMSETSFKSWVCSKFSSPKPAGC